MLLGSFAYDQWQRYDETLALAHRDTRNASALLAESTAQSFEGIDKTLRAVVSLQQAVAAAASGDPARVHDLLKAVQSGSAAVRAIGWTDADGNRLASSLDADPLPPNIADEEQFTAQRSGIAHGLYVSLPFRAKPSGAWTIAVSRPLIGPDGRFAGIAFGMVDPDYFARVLRRIALGPRRIAILLRDDGMVMVCEPPDDRAVARSLVDARLFRDQLARSPLGTFHGRVFSEGGKRIVSYARVPATAEVVAVGVPRADVLAPFRDGLARAGARIGFSLAVLLVGAWFLVLQLRRRQRADGKFRDLLEAAPDAMVIVDGAGDIALVNAEAERMFGYRREEMLGRSVEMLMPEQHRAAHALARAQYRDEPQHRAPRTGLELTGTRRDGGTFPVEIALGPLATEAGLLVSSTIRDITERKRAEAELAKAKLAAELASRAKSDFLSRMSHELRTPLNAVLGFAQLLQLDRERTLTASQRNYAGHIITGGRHLLDLVNEVLDLAGIESGRIRLSIERVAIRDVVEAVRTTMMPLAEQAGIAFDTGPMEHLSHVRADDLRLRQILINLVANAIKYNRPGGAVRFTAERTAGERVRFVVADNGIGIAAERHKDIFQPFQRLGAEYTTVEGAGIGLALARQLVEAMGGTIGFTSELGRGSTFWIELRAEAGGAGATQAGAVDGTAARVKAGGFSLLYVEDDPSNLRLVEQLLSTLPDVAMLSAANARLGLALATARRPDVIVLDLDLPGTNGFAVLRQLKLPAETRGIPVIALSASAFPSDIERGLAAGFVRYVTKPIDIDSFLAAVDAALLSTSSGGDACG